MNLQIFLAEALGLIGGGIAVLATLPALAKALKDTSAQSQTWLPIWVLKLLAGGDVRSRTMLAVGNTCLALSLLIAGGPKFLTICAIAAAVLNAWIAVALRSIVASDQKGIP